MKINFRAFILMLISLLLSYDALPQEANDGAALYIQLEREFTLSNTIFEEESLHFIEFRTPRSTISTYVEAADIVRDNYDYDGLAFYLGEVLPIAFNEAGKPKILDLGVNDCTEVGERWAGYRGRFKFILFKAEGGRLCLSQTGVTIYWSTSQSRDRMPKLAVLSGNQDMATQPSSGIPDIRKLQYIHLPTPLRWACTLVESFYRLIVNIPGLGWVSGLVIFAVAIKLFLMPITELTSRWQREVGAYRTILRPQHLEIKKTLRGSQAHEALMKTYRDQGITPYYTLKPMLATFISLPVLIAIFNMLATVGDLKQVKLLWVDSLAYPDKLFVLPFELPALGGNLNFLPFIMCGTTLLAALFLKNQAANPVDLRRQRHGIYLMAVTFLFIFYTFPSGMILYWTLATLLGMAINPLKQLLRLLTL